MCDFGQPGALRGPLMLTGSAMERVHVC